MNAHTYIDSPVGRLLLCCDGIALTGLYMDVPGHAAHSSDRGVEDPAAAPLHKAARQLGEYFAGERREFNLAMKPSGTEFQRRVWTALEEIPYGETWSYARLAQRVGNPKACRAVGLANGRNPLSIVIPCHRVIGADGSLTGYGGGVERKRWLLAHEKQPHPASSQPGSATGAEANGRRPGGGDEYRP